jgi:hypothetical protein
LPGYLATRKFESDETSRKPASRKRAVIRTWLEFSSPRTPFLASDRHFSEYPTTHPSEIVWPASTAVLISCSMKWLRISLVIQIILATYFQAVLWFPLGSWNDQPGKRLITLLGEGHALAVLSFALAMLLPVLLFALSLWKRWVSLMWVGLMGYGVWAALQIQSWWIPWIFGIRSFSKERTRYFHLRMDTLHPTRCTSFSTCFSSQLS